MHSKLFVTFNRIHAITSREARGYVEDFLTNYVSFLYEDQDDIEHGSAFFDWFVIGGRYSGALTRARRKKEDPPRLQRNIYKAFGYEDDAQIIDGELYLTLLAPYENTKSPLLPIEPIGWLDLDGDVLNPSFINKKWLVVADCHQ
jgi:hypothetical protein